MALTCFHCSAAISDQPTSIGFRDTCPSCGSDIHVCRNCQFYDPGSHHECRESSAEWVRDKERRNVCDYFKAGGTQQTTGANAKAAALSALDALFKK